MPTVADDGGNAAIIPRTFRPLTGTGVNLVVTAASQALTPTQTIPQGGCNVRISTDGTSNVFLRINKDGAAAQTTDMKVLPNTVEVFTILFGDLMTVIGASTGSTVNATLGYGG